MKTLNTILSLILFLAVSVGVLGYMSRNIDSDKKSNDEHTNPREIVFSDKNDQMSEQDNDIINISYTWFDYDKMEWSIDFQIDRSLYNEYRKESRKNKNDGIEYDLYYAQFVSDTRDDEILVNAIEDIMKVAKKNMYSDYDIANIFLSLVQSLEYTDDLATRAYFEYPRYPLETLVDGGGDCEDTAVLLAQLLDCAGVDSVLLAYEDHMAVGVKCVPEGNKGYYLGYYTFGGSRYYYTETTDVDWYIGEIPGEYFDIEAVVLSFKQNTAEYVWTQIA